MSVIRWEEPPQARARDIWARTADELMEKPGEWALVLDEGESAYALGSVRQSMWRHGCEVRTRTTGRKSSVWARWPPEAAA